MNNAHIQSLLDSVASYGTCTLPCGEFEGPFVISKPCTVIGDNTTLWSGNESILTVKAAGVVLKNLRIEITNDSLPPHKNISVYSMTHDTVFENVEIIGNLAGISGEENYWGVPKVLNLGRFPSDKRNTFTAILDVPVKTEISAKFYDVTITPTVLNAGRNIVTITADAVRGGSYIYGEILLKSAVTRRIYLSGSADESLTECFNDTLIFEASEYNAAVNFNAEDDFSENIIYPEKIFNHPNEQTLYAPNKSEEYIVKRGQHIPISASNIDVEMVCTAFDFPIDIDTFAFMLDSKGVVKANGRFIFYNNDHSLCGSVKYLNAPDKRVMYANLKNVPKDVMQIDMAFSIYDNAPDVNFSRVKDPAIKICCDDGKTYIFPLAGKLTEKTIVGIELRRKDSEWILSPLGMIYKYGINELCDSYGVIAQ